MGSNFSENFAAALPQGIALSRELKTRKKEHASQQAMEVLAEFEADEPWSSTFDASTQGVPVAGQTVQNPNQGFSGDRYAEMRDRYFEAAARTGDMDLFTKASEAWGAARMNKINTYGMAAVNAYDRGDMEGAKKMFLSASAYLSPGTTPEVQVDPKSGAFIVANYGPDGNPSGGMAMTRDNLLDIVMMNNDPQAWSEYNWTKTYQGAQLDQLRKRDAANIAETTWRTTFMKTKEEREVELHAIETAAKLAEARSAESKARYDEALEPSAITAGQKQNVVLQMEADKKAAELARAKADKALQLFTANFTSTRSDVEANQAAQLANASDPGPLGWAIVGKESGKGGAGFDWTASNDVVGAGGLRGHWGRGQFGTALLREAQDANVFDPNMTPRQFASDTPEGRAAQIAMETWQVNRINDFIDRQGLAQFEGQTDANGTMITREGMIAAAHIAGLTGLNNYLRTGEGGKDVNGNGAAEYMALVLQPGAGPAVGQPAAPGPQIQTDPLTGAIIEPDKDDKKEPDDTPMLHPYLAEPPDENGFSSGRLRPGIQALASELAINLDKNNPDMTEEDIAHVLTKTFGPEQTTVIQPVEGDDTKATISDGLHKMKLDNSQNIVGNLFQFREDEAEVLQAMAPYDEQYVPQEPGPAAIPLPEQSPTPGPVQPYVTAPATVAGAPAAPAPPAPPGAIPEPPTGAAGAAPVPVPDDTAVSTTPPAQPVAQSVIARIPSLGPLVEAWQFRGAPPRGPELQQILQQVELLDVATRQQVLDELDQIALQARRKVVNQ